MSKITLLKADESATPATGKSDLYIKLDGSLATRDDAGTENVISGLSASQIKTQYESNADTNAFTDSEKTDLTTNTSASHSHANTSVLDATTASFLIADEVKINGIEAGATSDQTKSDIDGLGIDAATLDSLDSTDFVSSNSDSYVASEKVVNIITLSDAEYTAIVSPDVNTLYVVI
jgi:hypothetical protein